MGSHRSRWMDADLDALAELARTFFERECVPNEERWCEQQHVDRAVWTKAGELGLLCTGIPEEYGGGGDFRHDAVITLEQARALAPSFGGSLHSGIIAHYIADYGTDEQILDGERDPTGRVDPPDATLTPEEREALSALADHERSLRLEQERIPWADAIHVLGASAGIELCCLK